MTTLAPLLDKNGNVERIIGSSKDITERKRAEEVSLKLAAIVESSDDAIVGKSLEGTITSWNKGAERIYGYTAEEIVGKPISILLPPDRPDETLHILERIKQGKRVDYFETVRTRKDGERIHVFLSISPIKNIEGKIIGASAISRDITEYKKMEEEMLKAAADKQRMEELEKFAKVAVGRELKMVELKERIKELESKLKEITGKE